MKGFKSKLSNGDEIFVPDWPVDVAIENLAKAGKYIGTEALVAIAERNPAAVIVALAGATDPENASGIFNYFCASARINGEKMTEGTVASKYSGNLSLVSEIFATVVHAQYHDFFVSGLAKESSPSSTTETEAAVEE